MYSLIPTVLVLIVAGIVYTILFVGRREQNLPPGPPTVPVLGNLLQIPLKGAHFHFTKWAEQYGGIYTLKLGTGTAAVITDRRLVKELIDKKSAKYSERPKSYVAKLISGGDHILLIIIVNAWGLHNDTKRFPNPERFDPDHFKDVTTPAPELANGRYESRDHYGYGTGRRFCPGAHLAERNLFLAMSKLLWAFQIGPGKNGPPDTDPVTGYSEGFLVCANDFDASFQIREERAETIRKEFEEAKGQFEKYQPTGEETA